MPAQMPAPVVAPVAAPTPAPVETPVADAAADAKEGADRIRSVAGLPTFGGQAYTYPRAQHMMDSYGNLVWDDSLSCPDADKQCFNEYSRPARTEYYKPSCQTGCYKPTYYRKMVAQRKVYEPKYGYGYDHKDYGYGHDYGYKAPSYGYEKKDYGYKAPSYGYEQKDYGYKAPSYGYEKKDYGYKAPAYGYDDHHDDYGYEAPSYGYDDHKDYGYKAPSYGNYGRKHGYGGYGGYGKSHGYGYAPQYYGAWYHAPADEGKREYTAPDYGDEDTIYRAYNKQAVVGHPEFPCEISTGNFNKNPGY
jgi:hypothetical protein